MHASRLTASAVDFDSVSYASWFDSPVGRQVWADEERTMLAVLRPKADWRVLDAGCGDGRFAASLAKHVARVVGIDASAEMLRTAAARTSSGGFATHLARADLAALPFASESFDAVAAVTVLCFMPDPVAALTEVARVVRPGGSVVVGELGRWSPWALQRRVEARRHGGLWNSARFWSKRTLSAALIAAGLVPRDVRAAVFYAKMRIAARLMSRFDASFGAFTTVGAAFIAIAVAFVRPCNHSHYALRCPRGRAMAGRRANGISHPIRPVRHGDGHARTGPAPIL